MAKNKRKVKKGEIIAISAMFATFILSFTIPHILDKRISQPIGYMLVGIAVSIPIVMVFIESIIKLKSLKGLDDEKSKKTRLWHRVALVILVAFFCLFQYMPIMGTVALIQGPKTIRIINPKLTSHVSGGRHRTRTYYIEGRREFTSYRQEFGLGNGHDLTKVKELLSKNSVIEIEYYETIESSCSIKGIK